MDSTLHQQTEKRYQSFHCGDISCSDAVVIIAIVIVIVIVAVVIVIARVNQPGSQNPHVKDDRYA